MRKQDLARLGTLFTIAALLAAGAGFSGDHRRIPSWVEDTPIAETQPEERARGRLRFQPGAQALESLLRSTSARVTGFPLPGGVWVDMEVESSEVAHGGTRFAVAGPDGVHETEGPTARFFRGSVAGDPESLVALNVIDGQLAGFVRTNGKEYSFGPRSFTRRGAAANAVDVTDTAVEREPAGGCDGDLRPSGLAARLDPQALGSGFVQDAIGPGVPLVAAVAVEGTAEWVARHGGVAAAEAYTLNLMAQVSAIYEDAAQIRIQVPFILMNAAEPDGYSGGSNSTSTHLTELRAKWNGDPMLRDVFRSTVHLFGTYPSGGAGRAYLDVLCDGVPANASSYDFGVSLLEGAGASWERRLVAHELGHNFSSPHSHCYAPELDQCNNTESGCYAGPMVQTTGTVMSSCSVRLTVFHQREIDEALRPGAEAAFPACVTVAGSPGALAGQGAGALAVREASECVAQDLIDDDGGNNGAIGYSGISQAAWAKRFTPACHPFTLTDVDVQFAHASVAPGRPVRLVVYTESTGAGGLAGATLAHSQDVLVQAVGAGQWNHYSLNASVILSSGDYYVGVYDLLPDPNTTYIMDFDTSHVGDSWRQANGTDPEDYVPSTNGSWMIRARGRGLNPGSVVLSWGTPCNDANVPEQDYAVYQGSFGDWTDLTSLTCTTGRAMSWIVEGSGSSIFWLVVPQTSASEGSYGVSSFGERAPAQFPCRPQSIGTCQQ